MGTYQRTLVSTPLATVTPRVQKWLWEGRVPIGAPTLMSGAGGVGKSSLTAWLIARATTGKLDGDRLGEPINVALIATEDDLEAVLWPRLIAAGADPNRVIVITGKLHEVDGKGNRLGSDEDDLDTIPQVNQDLAGIRDQLVEFGAELLIIDPITSTQRDEDRRTDQVRDSLASLLTLAQRLSIGMVWISHTTKATGAGVTVRSAIAGSHEYWNLARSVLVIAEDRDTGYRIMSQVKNNYGKESESLAFSLETARVPIGDDQELEIGLAHKIGLSSVSVEEIITRSDDANLGELSQEILDLLSDGKQRARNEIADQLDLEGTQRSNLGKYLERLVKTDRIEKVSRGTYRAKSDNNTPVSQVTTVTNTSLSVESDTNDNVTGGCVRHNWPTDSAGDCAQCALEGSEAQRV